MNGTYDLREVLELADAPAPRTDFGIICGSAPVINLPPPPADNSFYSFSNPSSFVIEDADNDFHWMLRLCRLITGQGSTFGG
jgi:hypothetical protein